MLIVESGGAVHLMSLEPNVTCSLPTALATVSTSATAGMTGGVSMGNPVFWGGNTGNSDHGHTSCRKMNVASEEWEGDCAYINGNGRTRHGVYPMIEKDLWIMGKCNDLLEDVRFFISFMVLCG